MFVRPPEDIIERFHDPNRSWNIRDAMNELPVYAPDRAATLCEALADSPEDEDRVYVARALWAIISNDYEYGLGLWRRMLRDPSRRVRGEAHEGLEGWLHEAMDLDTGMPPNDILVDETVVGQLTWFDACNLLRTYIKAEARYLGAISVSNSAVVQEEPADPQALNTDSTPTQQ